jgi:hypothetical protein
MLVTSGPVFRRCALLTVWLGVVTSASAAIEIVGESQATFAWDSASGAVAGYHVYVSRNGAHAELHSTVGNATSRTIHGSFGDTIQVSAAAFDELGNTGPRSDPSEDVRFVEAAAPTPIPTTTPTATAAPTPTPTPDPTPSTTSPPADETPTDEDPLPLPSPEPAAAYDFNGDGYSDILFRNRTTGELALWQMNGSQIAAVVSLPMMDSGWLVAGAGDFDFDGITDILWYDPDRGVGRIWLMGDYAGDGEFDVHLEVGWAVKGAADFDGDGRSEIVIWNQTSRVEIWGLKEELVRYGQVSIRRRGKIVGFGDIDGDGGDDIIVQDLRKRRIEASLISADFSAQRVLVDRQRTARWGVIDSADYDGDGQSDLLWRDLSRDGHGSASVWHLTSNLKLSGDPLDLNLGSDHFVLGSADYDGDGSADLLVFDPSTRELTLWRMGGSGVLSFESLGTLAADWLPAGFNTHDDAAIQ